MADAEDTLSETQRDHRNDMISQGYDKISDDMADMLENVEYDISHSADKQLEIINSMLSKVEDSYRETFNKISSVITNTGFVGSTDFNNNQSQLGSSEGVKNQVSNASQSQTEANKNPSSSASGTVTSPIKDNKAENDRITNDIMKPEDTTNRKVAELKVSKSSVSVQEGQGTTLTYTIRPNDAVNKNLSISYSAPTIATASATNGVISINGVVPNPETLKLMKFTEKYLNGEGELDLAVANLAQNSFVQEAIDGMKMAQSQNISNMKKMGNVTVDVNQPVTFNGVSKNDIPTMEEFLKRAREDTTKYIVKELRKGGMQIKR